MNIDKDRYVIKHKKMLENPDSVRVFNTQFFQIVHIFENVYSKMAENKTMPTSQSCGKIRWAQNLDSACHVPVSAVINVYK